MYETKSISYFTNVRTDIIAALDGKRYQNVLELGAGGCDTLVYMKEKGYASTVTGVELFDIPSSNQQNSQIDHLFIASVESLDDLNLPHNHYDLIICGDILEHVFDPWSVLRKVKLLMSSKGVLVCSIPNFREFQTLRKIFLNGNFEYNPEGGILDRTHVRFFCKKNMIDLFTTSGFEINSIEPTFKWAATQKKRQLTNRILLGLFEEFIAYQYLIIAKKERPAS
jgi:2-polyprenyl-3-methyl-5-hydroxy-6-metoxy-1,4-benzoquinol methylase